MPTEILAKIAEPSQLALFEKEIKKIEKSSARVLSAIPNATMDYNLARISLPDASVTVDIKLYRGSTRAAAQ